MKLPKLDNYLRIYFKMDWAISDYPGTLKRPAKVCTQPPQCVFVMAGPPFVAEQRAETLHMGGIENTVDAASVVDDVMLRQKPGAVSPLTVLVGGHSRNSTGFPLQEEVPLPAEHLTKQTDPITSMPELGTLKQEIGSRSTQGTAMGNVRERLIQTNQGVRSQTAGVMGGGTSINMGIVAMENREFFEYLNEKHGWRLDIDLLNEAHQWISKAFKPMPQDTDYGSRVALSLQDEGYKPLFQSDERAKKFACARSGLGCHAELLPGHVWGGVTVFDKDNKFFRNAADVFLYDAPGEFAHPVRLLVKTEQFVERVLFASTNAVRPRAVCVTYRPASAEDMAPIGLDAPPPRKPEETGGILDYLLSYVRQLIEWAWPSEPPSEMACIRGHGEVILSAGAVHTPLILFRSGVGPREQLREIGVPEVAVMEQLGRNLSDRVLIPIQMFLKDKKRKTDRVPRVCQVLGARHHGPQCDGVGISERTLKCSLLTTEELSGPNVIHGLLWASHLLLPPSWRDHPAAHAVFKFVRFCEGKVQFQGTLQYPPACMLVEGLLDCLDRSISLFYFTTEPKSRGYIRQHKDGRIEVEANYLKNEQDLFDATRGVQSLIQQINGGRFNNIVEPLQPGSCPVLMLHTVVQLFLEFAQADDLPQYEKQLLSVRRHAADFQPYRHEQGRPQMPSTSEDELSFLRLIQKLTEPTGELKNVNERPIFRAAAENPGRPEGAGAQDRAARPVERFEEALGQVFKEREKLKQLFETGSAQQRRRQEQASPETTKPPIPEKDTLRRDQSAAQSGVCADHVEPACKFGPIHSDLYTTTCSTHDIFTKRYGFSACSSSPGASTVQQERSDNFTAWEASLAEAGVQQFFKERLPSGSAQWAATYPPILPRTDDPESLAAFAVTYMTSIWHFAGTAAVGDVVNHEFRVKGVKNLSIADASVLNQMTRLNPTATLITLGRYIGLLKAKSTRTKTARNTQSERKDRP
ncbi:glucose-methanol-choline domain-containing protein [Neospora caninum Liverpool]|uniref:Glucose-methanol-choline domain-containing protein n=1 Tax=Neospora caninum (strain Liverpool) TaxID=572307 RepID=F0VEA2_NEOCL|nr:glucose-methanol-choline domain-containing protein [Neospora caninum Liverpool]CBZ52046.1 glucose-methanol-choline domain-containing protein [Neospora caninum Liverpool]|eukprot:XP_003882078.1 glucose-methanol-choline domain-containing protein [Neospora caninum Liverpool]